VRKYEILHGSELESAPDPVRGFVQHQPKTVAARRSKIVALRLLSQTEAVQI
jgi:hypothetical protein